MSPVKLERLVRHYLSLGIPSISLTVLRRGEPFIELVLGQPDPAQPQQRTTPGTRYDLASVSKLFTTTAFMALVKRGSVALDQPVSEVLPEFTGQRPTQPYEDPLNWDGVVPLEGSTGMVDADAVTFRQLLSHTAGLPAWRPLFRQASQTAAREMALQTFFYYQPGSDTVYSDLGLILTGLAIERLTGQRLDIAVTDLVLQPWGLKHTGYLPVDRALKRDGIAATEWCQWRQRRIAGEVHDENAWRLNGIAGHAGIFSTARDLSAFGQHFLDGGTPVLNATLIQETTGHQFIKDDLRRGIGFQLWSPDPEASSNPFSVLAFGHTGFTGTSLWIDPQREAVVALLTNEVYRGRQERLTIPLRVDFHRAVVAALDAAK